MVEEGGMYEEVLGREYGRGGWMMIRDEIASIERVEHNTAFGITSDPYTHPATSYVRLSPSLLLWHCPIHPDRGFCQTFSHINPLLRLFGPGKCSRLDAFNICCVAGVQEYLHPLVYTVDEVRPEERFLCERLVVLPLKAVNVARLCHHRSSQWDFLP